MVRAGDQSLNHEWGYGEIFGWRLSKAQPCCFSSKDSTIGVCYAGQVLPYQYEQAIDCRWCELVVLNVAGNETMLWFHALRGGGMWYHVHWALGRG